MAVESTTSYHPGGVSHPSCIRRGAHRAPTVAHAAYPLLRPPRVHCCTVAPTLRPSLHPPRVHRCACRVPILCPSCIHCCTRRYVHCVPVIASVVTPVISDLRTGALRHIAYTYRASIFATAAGVHQPNDDEQRSGVLTLFTRGDECVLSSQRMDGRGVVSLYCIACTLADGDGEISSPNLFGEGGEGDIRTPNKKGAEGIHPLEATEGGTCQDTERTLPSEGQELVRDK